MNRNRHYDQRDSRPVPRTRGDEPPYKIVDVADMPCSPHARG